MDADTGQLLGLVTSNAKFGSRTFPRINFSIPIDQLRQLFQPPTTSGLSLDSKSLIAAIEDAHDSEECRWALLAKDPPTLR